MALGPARRALAQDPLFKEVLDQAQAHVDQAFTATGRRKRAAGSPFPAVAERIKRLQEERDELEAKVRETLSAEARMWLASAESSLALPALASDGVDKLPSPRAVEREVLVRVEKALDVVARQLHARVKLLDTMVGPQLPASTEKSSRSTATAKQANGAKPIATAKPAGVDGQRSRRSGTPSWSVSTSIGTG